MIELGHGASVLRLLPELGAAVASWQRDGLDILHPVSDPNLIAQHERSVAAYPLLPFSNRVGYGRFSFDGEHFQLAPNFGGEPHTIHGNGWEREWTVAEQRDALVTLTLEHTGPAAQWPFHYAAAITYVLEADRLLVTLRYENIDTRAQPVGLGLHPFFPRDADVELGFSATGVWQAGPDALPEALLAVAGDWRFDPIRAVADANLDNCYAGWGHAAVLRWPSRRQGLRIVGSAPFGHLVVFTPPGRGYLAVEPASNMTDAVNRMQIADTGLVVLDPGAVLEASVSLELFGL
ncbi:aldose 1-epimerase [Lichenicoccus sp.]|uniref:aldose 1-epimerase n=1 Tax=Lichenicoccus sp. TaxID=2781899 RepID=UPI003D0BF5BD